MEENTKMWSEFQYFVHDLESRVSILFLSFCTQLLLNIAVEGKAKLERGNTRDWKGASRIGLSDKRRHEGNLRVTSSLCFGKKQRFTYFSSRQPYLDKHQDSGPGQKILNTEPHARFVPPLAPQRRLHVPAVACTLQCCWEVQ